MSTTQRAPAREPRVRSAFGAAFLSLIFPGLGHAYAGAYGRALGFAAAPLLVIALGGGIVLRSDRAELIGMFASQPALIALFVANIVALVYRVIAAVDAWQVARFLNAADVSGGGRLGRARVPVHPLSIAGLLAVVLVMAAGHLAIGRYNVIALNLVNCVFSEGEDPDCEETTASVDPSATPEPTESAEPGASDAPSGSPTAEAPTPDPSAVGTMAPSLPPWNGKERLNILAVGVDAREGNGSSFNTDTLIVVSIDPETKQVAMFQVPRDMVDVPVPDNARSLWGSVYGGKINSWYNQNRNRTDLWPGKTAQARGFNSLKAILGKLYGLDIRYYVKVDFEGFRAVVKTLGGVQINVQMPVYESTYPAPGGYTRLYIPAGPQHMTGAEALQYARSRHRAAGGDFDRGRRQQRVLLSLKEQMSVQAVIANLEQLSVDIGKSVKTDIPAGLIPQLLSLADSVDTKNIRSYVFTPRVYATEYLGSSRGYIITPNIPRIRKAVKQAFSVSPALMAQRERVGAETATVWVYNASGRTGLASRNAEWLAYSGIEASAPNKRLDTAAKTKIVAYNGAETTMPETVKFLEKLYGVTVTPVTDPAVAQDFIVTLGRDAPDKEVPVVG
jgi:LCP family protein required for cell wall assembly